AGQHNSMILFSPAIAGCVFLAFTVSYIWVCLTSPLRKVPGPRLSLFTSWVLKWHEFHAHRTQYTHRLHLRYGPVVRIAPNEVAFASAEGVKEIYGSGGSGYDKTEFYNLFQVYGRRTMFSTLNKQDHAKRKRVLADRYTNTNILRSASLDGIKERSKRFVDRCSKSLGGSIDLFVSTPFYLIRRVTLGGGLHDYAFDCVSHHLFHPYGSDSLRDEEDEKIMLQVAFDDSLQNRLLSYYNPGLHAVVKNILELFSKPRETPLADNLPDAGQELRSGAAGHGRGMHRPHGRWYRYDRRRSLLPDVEISQPRSAHVQKRLQEEIRSADPSTPFDKLPYLDAVVMEGLRCFPAIPMSLPRYVPDGGRTIDGYYVPGGAIVSAQAYSTHRIDRGVFPEPERFNPDRWLEETGDLERKRLFFAFASGGGVYWEASGAGGDEDFVDRCILPILDYTGRIDDRWGYGDVGSVDFLAAQGPEMLDEDCFAWGYIMRNQ
ncbi:cytochrome P450 3A13, partial [Apiospora hydei]